jgi:exopolysaccharide biosynthesis polyprenyl glycosylphosphotransferase
MIVLILKSRVFCGRGVFVGTTPEATTNGKQNAVYSPVSSTIVGFIAAANEQGEGSADDQPPTAFPILGSLAQFADLIAQSRPDRIILALTAGYDRFPTRELIEARMAGIAVEDGIEVHEHLSGKLPVECLTPSWLLFCKDFRNSRWQTVCRRAVSVMTAAVGLLLTAPLMALIAVLIKLDSPGPVFFLQERAGLRGKTFRLVKFRTMRPTATLTETPSSVWHRDDEVRITGVGKWLRKLHLDELPQFVNVLRGDMDLIGPRPEIASNIEAMTAQIPYYALRMAVRPGLTGWAQVKHGYAVSQDDVTEKLRYDLYYIKHMSVWLDLLVAIDTIKILLCGPASQEQGTISHPGSYSSSDALAQPLDVVRA